MRSNITYISIFCVIWIVMFLSFIPEITRNAYNYDSNEMYWVQTARILPLMLEKKFSDPYWKEFYGFTNFNGAKWVYAVGLRLFGYTDFSSIGTPPDAYLLWKKYENAPFPKTDPMYSMLSDSRMISAFVASAGLGIMFLLAYFILNGNYIAAIFSVILLRIHPIIVYIATHALADSMLLTSEILILLLLVKLFNAQYRSNILFYVLLGIVLGYSASVKINAFMFYMVIFTNFTIWASASKSILFMRIKGFIIATIAAIGMFFVLHPNFFFFPTYTPLQMIVDRITVTHSDVAYYSQHDPSHVLSTISQRFISLFRHTFMSPILPFFVFGFGASIIFVVHEHIRKQWDNYLLQYINALVVGLFLFSYVVFDEQRYFMPLLPFVCLIGSSWIEIVRIYISSRGRYWSASAT